MAANEKLRAIIDRYGGGMSLEKMAKELSRLAGQEVPKGTLQYYHDLNPKGRRYKKECLPRDLPFGDALQTLLLSWHVPPEEIADLFGVETLQGSQTERLLTIVIERLDTMQNTLEERLPPPPPPSRQQTR